VSEATLATRPRRRDDVWIRQVREENAIYDPSTGSVHLLNETALAVWHLCDGDTTVGEMVESIVTLFDMHRDIVVEDVDRILKQFEDAGIVSYSN
jgi:hypothetical protein